MECPATVASTRVNTPAGARLAVGARSAGSSTPSRTKNSGVTRTTRRVTKLGAEALLAGEHTGVLFFEALAVRLVQSVDVPDDARAGVLVPLRGRHRLEVLVGG
jgi:hypothetical protein